MIALHEPIGKQGQILALQVLGQREEVADALTRATTGSTVAGPVVTSGDVDVVVEGYLFAGTDVSSRNYVDLAALVELVRVRVATVIDVPVGVSP